MKYAFFLFYFFLAVFMYSCSETQKKDKPFKSSIVSTAFNDFIPAYLSNVPNLEVKKGNYFNQVIGKFSVDAFVDSIHSDKAYWKIKDTSENIIYQGYALNGKKNGWWEVSKNNTLMRCGNYVSNKKNGFWKFYTLAGASRKIVIFKNDTLEGLAQEYNTDGILVYEGQYVRGLKSGYWKLFYNNGNIKEQGYFYDGYKSGWWQLFELNGNLLEEANYSRNKISGYTKKYLNGVLFEEGELFNDQKRGTWKIYDETGKLKTIQEYGE